MAKKTIKATNNYISGAGAKSTSTSAASTSAGTITSTSDNNMSTSSNSNSNSSPNLSPNSNPQRDFSSIATSGSSFDTDNDDNTNTSTSTVWSSQNPLNDMEEIMSNSGAKITIDELKDLALQPCTPLTLGDMYKYASANVSSKNYSSQRLRNAQFLHKELPIRIAQRAVDLLTLPHGLNKTQSIQSIAHIYLNYLDLFHKTPFPSNEDEELEFTKMLHSIVLDRNSIPEAIARGVFTLKDRDRRTEGMLDLQRLQTLEKALYRFFNARTGLRLLTEHHILSCKELQKENALLRQTQSCFEGKRRKGSSSSADNETQDDECSDDDDDYVDGYDEFGCIQKNCDPSVEARAVADQVMEQCRKRYGVSPDIEVIDCTPEHFTKADFTYVTHHLQYMLAELLKNSCRATVRRYMEGTTTEEDHIHHGQDSVQKGASIPSIRVVVAKGAEDVTIKIADKGGGVPRSVIDKMWTFAHSTLSDAMNSGENNDTHFEIDEFTGGSVKGKGFNIRGFGLPLARIYARYFGGELTLKSMEGYGVDAYLYLPVLGIACENLPKRVLNSPGQGDSVHDGNHHVYQGDSFSMSADEPWGKRARHFSTEAFTEKLSKVAL
eukprot:CAMPEP_0203670424 /NCGR_PEP_ID=MMETSP0090-20130426/6503_1 /ASSEMBLY_ACC=CAM_ASM_001088 /TAXON_ID=426623 /ORGANISM="Chaetoceros affinis, Strain CCMP159" /LENGTH=606 /DNA_ID=CAMNT_0050535283 /DNA_START=506 /DNA_END=2326 /DNA_ORIENTATION=-